MRKLEVELIDRNYNIYIEKNILNKVGMYLKEIYKNKNIAVITDDNVKKFYGETLKNTLKENGFNVDFISIEPGEQSKTMETLKEVYEKLSEFKLTRKDLIIALGGGVVGDLGGFAAATYLRGIPYVQIPTSLLAQVDSSVGGKVAVDLPCGKNLVGNFYQPKAVFIDSELLKTLDKRFLHDGLAEVIKYGCIKNKNIIDKLMSYKDDNELLNNVEDIIYECCSIKKKVVENDEKDLGERMILNFGHTLGHAVEKYFNYSKYTHGEAVAIGMMEITKKSEEANFTEKGSSKIIESVLKKYNLPFKAPLMDRKNTLNSISLDKKSNGESINLILLKKIGEGTIIKINSCDVGEYI